MTHPRVLLRTMVLALIGLATYPLAGPLSGSLVFDQGSVKAQFYDTVHRPNVKWFEMESARFRVIYHEGFEEVAVRAAMVLESEYERIVEYVGGRIEKLPVVINGYNDMGNGFVTTLHFRIEVESAPIRGKILNTAGASRLESLMAHELVHALHFSEKGSPLGLTALLYLFAPDAARSVHGITPPGITEGIAVHVESTLHSSETGRGNFAPFTNAYYQQLFSDRPWSASQMVTPSSTVRPADRYYIGGYHFTQYLLDSYGEDVLRRAIRNHANFPLIGFTTHVRLITGTPTRTMLARFREHNAARLSEHLEAHDVTNYPLIQHPQHKGELVRNPQWLDNHRIVYYGAFYNARPGFYVYDIESESHSLLFETRIDESFQFAVSEDSNRLTYARYHIHPVHFNRFTLDVHQLDIRARTLRRITHNDRIHGGSEIPDSDGSTMALVGLQTRMDSHVPVRIDPSDGTISTMEISHTGHPDKAYQVQQLAPSPDGTMIAMIVSFQAQSGILLAQLSCDNELIPVSDSGLPHVHFAQASLYDLSWSPDGSRLLFSSDYSGVLQVYEYDIETSSVFRLTGGPWNIHEASYSPDQTSLALVVEQENQKFLSILGREDLTPVRIENDVWNPAVNGFLTLTETYNQRQLDIQNAHREHISSPVRYRSGFQWLKPRMFYPWATHMGVDKTYAFGAGLHSGELLRRHAYDAALLYGRDRLFYDFQYRYTGIFPTIELNALHMPYSVTQPDPLYRVKLYGEEREFGVSFPVTIQLDHHNSTNQWYIRPQFVKRSSRIFIDHEVDSSLNRYTDWSGSDRFRISTAYAHRIKQRLRDVDASSGIILYAQADRDVRVYNRIMADESLPKKFAGLRIGSRLYTTPIPVLNHTFSVDLQKIFQNRPGYNSLNMVHEGFKSETFQIPGKDFYMGTARYTIPLMHPETGWYVLPAYIERIYGVVFAQALAGNNLKNRQYMMGAGIRARFRILYHGIVDIGIGVGFQPGKNGTETLVIGF